MNNVADETMNTSQRFKWRNDACAEDYVVDRLKPIRYQIDTFSGEWEKRIIDESGLDLSRVPHDNLKYAINGTCMYYKIMKANQMAIEYANENDFQYDVIIRARLDFIWEDHIKLNDFKNIDDKTIFLIKDRYATHSRLETNDKFFAGSTKAMEIMCNLYNCIITYQNAGMKIECQTLNENHIKKSGLSVGWIGHSQTYYKCMGRHAIKITNRNIYINNDITLSKFWYQLAYHLMYQNYFVYYLNPDEEYDELLKCFPNFRYYDGSPVQKMICTVGYQYCDRLGGNQIIVNSTSDKRCTSIQINQNIGINDLIDFIFSLITMNRYCDSFSFTKKKTVVKASAET
jgi:hypothetical protein